ncbi:hypothetical protein [Tautonia plasticadhaerens]|uniref:hypothetical protein n=1 Tax=Tautonia plasticadhaerens TaxID=2527974 RepID=UPI0011A7F714|nr:hypothetical protein [Tautonia plasticadhaerens]
MYESTYDGIRFIEGKPNVSRVIGPVRVELGGLVSSSQLMNLDDVKRTMAVRVKDRGGNAVINFTYGQKSVGFLKSLFLRDDVNWFGEGQIALIP